MKDQNLTVEERIQRAQAADREQNRGLSEICERLEKRFGDRSVHQVYLFYSPRIDTFASTVFYQKDRDIAEAEKSGLSAEILEALKEELEREGRGNRKTVKATVEFDSDEGVERDFDGNYFMRMR